MEGVEAAAQALRVLLPVGLLLVGWGVGRAIERAHFRRLRLREIRWRRLPAVTITGAPDAARVERAGLVTGSVVISIDHWKRLVAWLRSLFGGRIRAYESLLERARREALLRMKESAAAAGYDCIVGVRLETARLANARSNGEGTAGVEVLAFGTGICRRA